MAETFYGLILLHQREAPDQDRGGLEKQKAVLSGKWDLCLLHGHLAGGDEVATPLPFCQAGPEEAALGSVAAGD